MHSIEALTPDQQTAVNRIYEHNETIFIASTGAGKTVVCLTAIQELINDKVLRRVIVACPARVLTVWSTEKDKWEHLSNLHVQLVMGNSRERIEKVLKISEVLVVSLNNLSWLLEQEHRCDGIVIDELSKASGIWTHGLRSKKKSDCITWRVGMTATPVSQDFQRFYAMARIIDHGKALGTNKERYMNDYFYPDYGGYTWTLRDGAVEAIMNKVRGLVHTIEDTKEADLPELIPVNKRFDMPEATRKNYNEMKKEFLIGNDDTLMMKDVTVEAANEAVKSGKLRQIASGFVYTDDGSSVGTHPFDVARIDALAEHLQAFTERRKIIIFYEYQAHLSALQAAVPYTTESIDQFTNDNETWFLLAQINAFSHGIEGLQYVCHDVVMYHPMWSRDATEQAIGRIWRRGQKHPVNVTTLVCNDTLDDLVLERVEDRGEFMKLFIKHLKKE